MLENATEKYTEIKVKLIQKQKSLRAWAIENGEPVNSVYNAVKGDRNGKQSKRIRAKLKRFLK